MNDNGVIGKSDLQIAAFGVEPEQWASYVGPTLYPVAQRPITMTTFVVQTDWE